MNERNKLKYKIKEIKNKNKTFLKDDYQNKSKQMKQTFGLLNLEEKAINQNNAERYQTKRKKTKKKY